MISPISKHFTVIEAMHSQIAEKEGINNAPPAEIWPAIHATAAKMDKIRDALGHPIFISSWYRCVALCLAIGSKETSRHAKGEAVDWACPRFGSVYDVARFLASRMKEFEIDQLILEKKGKSLWIHTGFAVNPARVPRYQVLSLLADGTYANGLTYTDGKVLT